MFVAKKARFDETGTRRRNLIPLENGFGMIELRGVSSKNLQPNSFWLHGSYLGGLMSFIHFEYWTHGHGDHSISIFSSGLFSSEERYEWIDRGYLKRHTTVSFWLNLTIIKIISKEGEHVYHMLPFFLSLNASHFPALISSNSILAVFAVFNLVRETLLLFRKESIWSWECFLLIIIYIFICW